MDVSMISGLPLTMKIRKKLCKTFAMSLGITGPDALNSRGLS
jgi:hypothetical protein